MRKKYYLFNQETLAYDQVSFFQYFKRKLIFLLGILVLFFAVGLIVGYINADRAFTEEQNRMANLSKHDLVIGGPAWRDSVMADYKRRADLYLSQSQYKGTPLNGEILALCAMNAYDSTGILLPVELSLAQAQWESGMGLKGKSPRNNPYNIGEWSDKTVLWYDNTFEGVQAYYYFMCNDYLKCRDIEDLFKNFVNCGGKRYASGEYEQHVPQQYYYIKKWLNKRLGEKTFEE